LAEASRLEASDGDCSALSTPPVARRPQGVVVMNSVRHHVARSLLTAAALAVCLVAPSRPASPAPAANPAPAGQELVGIRPEGRLRKLHLVRPDLIPYPIAYEVYC
jgi:hypothetical protein